MTDTTPTAEWNRDTCVTYLQINGMYAGHSRDSIDQLRQLVTEHQASLSGKLAQAIDNVATGKAGSRPDPELLPDGPERVAAAKAEHKLLKAWAKDGEKPPKPATPNLDAMNADYAAGVTAADRRAKTKGTKTGKRATAEQVPAPTPGKGYSVVPLRNVSHGEVVALAIELVAEAAEGQTVLDQPDMVRVEGPWLVLRTTSAQDVFDALVAATDGATQFHTRLLVLAQLGVRHACRKVTDGRTALLTRLVDQLVGSMSDWSVTWAADATPVFTINGIEYTTTRAAAEAVGVSTKANVAA